MPGIVGIVTKAPGEAARQELCRMVEAIHHESFYQAGTWAEESQGIYVGWVARCHSFSDGMPLHNESHDVCLVFSGEEFPEPGTSRHLKDAGHAVETGGPNYLVHMYEDDPAFPKGLNGRFHGLVTDRARGTATLFNDRYGMHRLYYYESREAFYFAVEAKAILSIHPELRRANARSLGELVACGCVLGNRTLFEKVFVLPPASAWVFRGGALARKGVYFEPKEWEQQEPLNAEAYYQELRQAFTSNLPRYFNGQEQIGMSLTGGLDSRMIMAWHKSTAESLPCYSFGGTFRDCEDVRLAQEVARSCGLDHRGHPGRPAVSFSFSTLCGTGGISYRRMC